MGANNPIAGPEQSLTVIDNRTGKSYTVPITNNSIPATAFKGIKASRNAVIGKSERPEDETEGGIRVYDPGYMNTAVLRSNVTYINGEEGILRYRGYPIEQLASKSNFLEVAYLLIYGELPTKERLDTWENEVMHHSYVHNDIEPLFRSFRYDSHPMAMLTSGFAALGAFAPEANPSLQGQTLYTRGANDDEDSLKALDKQIFRLIGKAPTLAAMAYRVRQGRPFNRPPHGLSYAGTFLYLLDVLNEKEYKPNPVFERALDVLFILHADHEMNCSAAAVLQTGSSLVDPYSAVAAGCAALYGPLHGGANEAVIRMLVNIGTPANVPAYIEKVKKKESVLSGFGHRVYKRSDPRSFIIRETAAEVFKLTGKSELLDTAIALHDAALKDEYFVKRNLYPNVDFWSGLIYREMGFPMDFFPVLFAVPRVVGWLAHWRQMMLQSGGVKIWRPRQVYVGEATRDYIDVQDRREEDDSPKRNAPMHVQHGGDSRRSALATYKDEAGRVHVRSRL